MATDDDTLAWARPKSTLIRPKAAERLPAPEEVEGGAELSPGDDLDPLPTPGSPYTAACARPSNKPETVLHVLLKNGQYQGFAWANFDSVDLVPGEKPGGGPLILLRFAGLFPTELRIEATNPGRLLANLGRQRIAWIRERPDQRGFDGKLPAATEPADIITVITPRKLDA